jgi:hypothetical protein
MPTHMTNFLQIGHAPKDFDTPPGSLSFQDEPIPTVGVKIFDPTKHGLNPLPLKYPANREFAAGFWPDKDLMTYRNGRFALARLVTKAKQIEHLNYGRSDGDKEAKMVMEDMLMSPLLRAAFRKEIPRWLCSGETPIIARLNRKEIGDDDAKIIFNILVLLFKRQIIVEDFGAYARDHHARIIREERLIAGVNTLSELPEKLRDRMMLMEKFGAGCTYDDAVELAKYDCTHAPHTEGYNAFIRAAMAP